MTDVPCILPHSSVTLEIAMFYVFTAPLTLDVAFWTVVWKSDFSRQRKCALGFSLRLESLISYREGWRRRIWAYKF